MDKPSQSLSPRLNIVTLGVQDLNRSRTFYQNALGWSPSTGSDEQIAFYNQTGIIFALYPIVPLAEDAACSPERSGFSGITLAINLPNKTDVDTLFAQIIAHGGTSLVEPVETFWGGYHCYFADPDGHHWEISWAPFWELDEQGNLLWG